MILYRDTVLVLVFTLFPLCAFTFDLFGYATFHGKVIDADTLKPIEGTVVVAEWDKCRPGFFESEICDFEMVKEAQTDANGEWSICGPKGTHTPGIVRGIIGYIYSWTAPPRFQIYKQGYCRLHQKPGGLHAYPYVNKEKRLEGIVLVRMGDTKEEENEFMKQYLHEGLVPFIPIKDPEKKLHDLDFDFQYPHDVRSIRDVWVNTMYDVIGLKKAETQEEKKEAQLSPATVDHWIYLPLLRKTVENSMK